MTTQHEAPSKDALLAWESADEPTGATMTNATAWPQDRLRNLIDGLENVQLVLAEEVGAAGNYKLDFVQFTPAEADELAAFVKNAADFLRELEAIIRAEAKS